MQLRQCSPGLYLKNSSNCLYRQKNYSSPRRALEAADVNNLGALLSLAVKVHEVRDVGKLKFDVADGGVPATRVCLSLRKTRKYGRIGVPRTLTSGWTP